MHTADSIKQPMPLCQQFGFNEHNRLDRITLMGLNDADRPLIRRIHTDVIKPNHQPILNEFYNFVMSFASMRRFIPSRNVLEKLKHTQASYLLSLGHRYETEEYFEYRLRVGIVHERIGMPLSIYLAAYRNLTNLLMSAIPASISDVPDLHCMILGTINKIIMLDMSLAIDTYSFAHDSVLNESIGELVDERDTLTIQLMQDALTGVFTRQFILGVLEKNLAQLKRQPDRNIIVAMFDLDNFKLINDTYGHICGDEVLKRFAKILQSSLRDQDYFGRYGGEEFLLLLPETSLEQALQLAERLRKKIEKATIKHENKNITITTSIGLTIAKPNETTEDVIDRADRALYIAKKSGRNKVVRI